MDILLLQTARLKSQISLCNLCVLCVSVVNDCLRKTTTETQRTQRLHREEHGSGLQHLLCLRVAEAGDFGDDHVFNTFGDATDGLFVEELLETQVNRKHIA